MIISASYKTDIPAFYGEWFRNRLDAGFCRMTNPYNRRQKISISLQKDDVDGFIFWTKNLGPFMNVLEEVHARAFPFVVQYTINGYPRALESRVVDAQKAVKNFRSAADIYGSDSMIWRYDTIIFSTLTDADFHRRNFATLVSDLAGSTDEVVVSFMQLYRKTRRNMTEAAREGTFMWYDPASETKRELLADLVELAGAHDMRLSVCTQPELMVPGAQEARCVDGERLMKVADQYFRTKIRGMRTGCGCYEAKDIGEYDTCPHGCVYCYAVHQRPLALKRYQSHDPRGEYLYPPNPELPHEEMSADSKNLYQIPLFPPTGPDALPRR